MAKRQEESLLEASTQDLIHNVEPKKVTLFLAEPVLILPRTSSEIALGGIQNSAKEREETNNPRPGWHSCFRGLSDSEACTPYGFPFVWDPKVFALVLKWFLFFPPKYKYFCGLRNWSGVVAVRSPREWKGIWNGLFSHLSLKAVWHPDSIKVWKCVCLWHAVANS